jgi:hypothetical protein
MQQGIESSALGISKSAARIKIFTGLVAFFSPFRLKYAFSPFFALFQPFRLKSVNFSPFRLISDLGGKPSLA